MDDVPDPGDRCWLHKIFSRWRDISWGVEVIRKSGKAYHFTQQNSLGRVIGIVLFAIITGTLRGGLALVAGKLREGKER